MFIRLVSCLMLLIKFMFHIQIIKLEKWLTQVENELKAMKEEARKEATSKKEEETKRMKEATKDMVATWMKNGG
jgi:hypothetical protein